jgi:glycosyltransferase involved in cell wall biosynthesis
MGVYNVQHFIGTAIGSVLAQSHEDFELIVTDDGSEDETADRIASFDDPRIHLLRAEHQGSAAARNLAIGMATGDWVAFLDGDDFWEPGKLERYRAFLPNHPELDLCYDRARFIDEAGNDLGYLATPPPTTPTFESLLRHNTISCGSVPVVRRQALNQTDGFCPLLPAAIDLDLWLRIILLRPDNAAYLPDVLTAYRRRAGQISNNWRRMAQGREIMLSRLEKLAPDRVARVKGEAAVHFNRFLAYLAREQGETRWAWQHMIRSFTVNPFEAVSDRGSIKLVYILLLDAVVPRHLRIAIRRAVSAARK